jgi:hypothetical protein
MPNLPKFTQKLQDQIGTSYDQQATSGYGMILKYYTTSNTAMVLMSSAGSDNAGEIYDNVPCPVYKGVQTVAPNTGTPVWVDFKDKDTNSPIVTTYWNHEYKDLDYKAQTMSVNSVPRYMLWI